MESSELCRECRAPVQRGLRFCGACGQAVDGGLPDGERRQLTLLFCDMVGSSALSERLDPEDLRDLLSTYQRFCRDAIVRYEGHISQFLGDGVMAYFGYPTAYEDDAVRAIYAALRIIDATKLANEGIGKRLGAEIHVRAGLHTGEVVVGDVAPGARRDQRAIGESVNLAARIQTFADVDTVVVSSSTARLVTGYFEFESLGAHVLKGFARPIELYRVLRKTGARTKFEAAARGKLTPHVGRERELGELTDMWNQVKAGHDRAVIIRGEGGIGKSRILHQFRQTVFDEAVRVVECFCSPLTQATALAPIIEMLNEYVAERVQADTMLDGRLDALASLLAEHSRFGPDVLPLMAALLSIPGADETPIADLSPVRRRARTLEIMRAWLIASAERAPVALLIEDVHWADPSTLEYIDLLVRERPGGRTLLCITARPEFDLRWPALSVHPIELSRLSAIEIEAMVQHVAGGGTLPSLVVGGIAGRSEGVPLFVEEVTKTVLESGALRLDGDHYELAHTFDERVLPATIQGSLVARFDRLGESRRIAQLGAAIGREFSYALIRAVANVPDDELREHLDRLSRSELAFARGEIPNAVFVFKHALIQDAIYATLLRTERARVHERIFTTLRETAPEIVAAQPETAAYHAEHAGRRDVAVPLLLDAGVRALGRTAVAEAVKHLGRGIDLVDSIPEPARRNMEIDLRAAIGPAYMATVGWASPEVERSSARLKDLAVATGSSAKLLEAMWGLWTVHFLRGQLDPALDAARQVLDMAFQTNDPASRVVGHHAVGYTHFYRGEYDEAIRHADDGLMAFDFEQEKRLASIFQLSSTCAMRCFKAQSLRILGYVEEASLSLYASLKLAQQLRHAPSLAYLQCMLCYFFRTLDDIEQVKWWASRTRALSLAEGFSLWVPLADVFLAWTGAREGVDPEVAAEKIARSMVSVHQGLTYLTEPDLAVMQAETLILARRPHEALRVAQEALAVTRVGKQRHGEPELFRLQGEAVKASGDEKKAATFYRQGMESAHSMGSRLHELRCSLALSELFGGPDVSMELRKVLAEHTEGFDLAALKEVLAFANGATTGSEAQPTIVL